MNSQEELNKAFLKLMKRGDLAACSAALDGGADIRAVDSGGRGALYWAAVFEHADVVSFLLKREGAEEAANDVDFFGYTPLHGAAGNGGTKMLELLVDSGELSSLNAVTNYSNYTPLANASMGGHVDSVRVLLRAGANPFLKCSDGYIVRELALRFGYPPVAAVLDEFDVLVSKCLPALAITLEELERLKGIFIPREIINLMLSASFEIGFGCLGEEEGRKGKR